MITINTRLIDCCKYVYKNFNNRRHLRLVPLGSGIQTRPTQAGLDSQSAVFRLPKTYSIQSSVKAV
jgi:hypothetical protein